MLLTSFFLSTTAVWPKVLPYCILNVIVMILLHELEKSYASIHNVVISPQGHKFITLVVAFLLVSRVNTALGRYNEARGCLGAMYMMTRELGQQTSVFSLHDASTKAKEWRSEVLYRLLLLLNTSMAVIDYPETSIPAWDCAQLTGEEKVDVDRATFNTVELQRWAHTPGSEWEESMRVPIRISYLLRKSIHKQKNILNRPMECTQETILHSSVDKFLAGYYDIVKLLTTPVPFPLVQMARTFLFLYVFAIPFVLWGDESSETAHCISVFLLTFGFMGLDAIALELDNPFGNDANDIDNDGLAVSCYEDTYLTILDVDGKEAADNLRLKMHGIINEEVLSTGEQGWLLSKVV
jgi:predicted membrane chloride channel (bestrophin family)